MPSKEQAEPCQSGLRIAFMLTVSKLHEQQQRKISLANRTVQTVNWLSEKRASLGAGKATDAIQPPRCADYRQQSCRSELQVTHSRQVFLSSL